jgi:hypothetical protein
MHGKLHGHTIQASHSRPSRAAVGQLRSSRPRRCSGEAGHMVLYASFGTERPERRPARSVAKQKAPSRSRSRSTQRCARVTPQISSQSCLSRISVPTSLVSRTCRGWHGLVDLYFYPAAMNLRHGLELLAKQCCDYIAYEPDLSLLALPHQRRMWNQYQKHLHHSTAQLRARRRL